MTRPARAVLFVGGLLVCAALPVVGRELRSGGRERCALDGVAVPAATRVRVVDESGLDRPFCCVDCARRWLANRGGRPRGIFATDETTGAEVPAGEAWFVESRVPAFAVCGCNVHTFAREADALRHAEAFGGRILAGDEGPLRPKEGGDR